MRPALAAALLHFTFLTSAIAANDAPIRMDEIECQHVAGLSEQELSFLLAWLDGYFNHMHGTATLSDGSLAALGKMIQEECTEAPTAGLMDALNNRIRLDALGQHP